MSAKIREFSIDERLIIKNLSLEFINLEKSKRFNNEYYKLLDQIYDYLFYTDKKKENHYLINPNGIPLKLPENIFLCIELWSKAYIY